MSFDQFWEAFLPNFASTVFGILLGLPVAFWIERLSRRSAIRAQEAENRRRLRDSLQTLLPVMASNRDEMQAVGEAPKSSQVTVYADLDTEVWEAVREPILTQIQDCAFAHAIARHFSRIRDLERLYDMRYQLAQGFGSDLISKGPPMEVLGKRIESLATQLVGEAEELARDIERRLAQLAG